MAYVLSPYSLYNFFIQRKCNTFSSKENVLHINYVNVLDILMSRRTDKIFDTQGVSSLLKS